MRRGKHWQELEAEEAGRKWWPHHRRHHQAKRHTRAPSAASLTLALGTLALLVALGGPSSQLRGSPSLASAALLDEVGQVSVALGRLVDGLLERASYLAELVIAEAREEQCDWQPALSCASPKRWPDLGEVTKVSGCRLLGVGVPGADLPAEGMEACCDEHRACYGRCDGQQQPKLACDQAFGACLRLVCRRRYDPGNASLLASELELEAHEPWEPAADELELGGQREEEEPRASARAERRLRDKYKACRLAGKLLIIGNLAFGCHQFQRERARACCPAHLPVAGQLLSSARNKGNSSLAAA